MTFKGYVIRHNSYFFTMVYLNFREFFQRFKPRPVHSRVLQAVHGLEGNWHTQYHFRWSHLVTTCPVWAYRHRVKTMWKIMTLKKRYTLQLFFTKLKILILLSYFATFLISIERIWWNSKWISPSDYFQYSPHPSARYRTKRLEFMLSVNLSKMGLGKRNQIKPRMPLRYQCSSAGIIEKFWNMICQIIIV